MINMLSSNTREFAYIWQFDIKDVMLALALLCSLQTNLLTLLLMRLSRTLRGYEFSTKSLLV